MKLLKQFLLGVLAIIAWSQIGISGNMLQVPRAVFTMGHYAYPVLLLGSILYLQWSFRVFLMPLSHLDREQRQQLRQQALAQYSNGFLAGTVALGYLLVAAYIFGFFAGLRDQPTTPNLVWPGVFFIALGTLAQVRGLVRHLSGNSRQSAELGAATLPSHE
jgi:hypothetical protein